MNPARKRQIQAVITTLLLCSMFFSLAAPVVTLVQAQEATSEPTVEATPEVVITETPLPPTEPPTAVETPGVEETSPAEATTEPTLESTEEATDTPVISETPALEPTAAPETTVFQDDFQDGEASGWILSAGWQMTTENDNTFLKAAGPGETAAIAGIDWTHLLLSVRVRVEPEGIASVSLRSGTEHYSITLDSKGTASLYRSGALLAQGSAAADSGGEAQWKTLYIQALGDSITVGVDGVVQFSYSDPAPLGPGAIIFANALESTGEVALDDVVIHRLDAPSVPPPTDSEAAETPAPESTESPEVTGEPDSLVPVLSADFESEPVGWTVSKGSIESEGEANHALALNAEAGFAPADPLYFADLRIDARVKLSADASSSLSLTFRAQDGQSYTLLIETGQIALIRDDGQGPLQMASTTVLNGPDTWQRLSLSAAGGLIAVSLDDAAVLSYADDAALLNGQIGFSGGGAVVLLDDIAVYDLTDPDLLAEATETPALLTGDAALKLSGALRAVIELHMSGSVDEALALAENYYVTINESGQAAVVIYAADGYTAADVVRLVEVTGGAVQAVYETMVEALVPLASVPALASVDAVRAISLPEVALSTSAYESASENVAQAGSVLPHSLDIIGWRDWNAAGITGSGVNVAVIDRGFNTAGAAASDRACFGGAPLGNGSGNHGINMVEVICDIAPNANVRGYRASNAAEMTTAVTSAQNQGNRVIVIALDLGAHVSPGDGTGGGNINALYTAIANARAAGILVIASAGNSYQPTSSNDASRRYVTLNYTGTTTNMTLNTAQGEVVSISWSAWGTSGSLTSTLQGAAAESRAPGGPPGYQITVPAGCGSSCTRTLSISGSGSYTVQVQVGPSGSINVGSISGATVVSSAGSIARPADSPNVLAVGAVCPSQTDWYPIMPSSSRGPIFTPGGTAPLPDDNTRASIKPDLVAPAYVSTSLETASSSCYDNDTLEALEPDDGFSGTSAAAAHVAGMAALLISNTNSSMSVFDSGPGAADALQNYLQTHSIDLYPVPTPGLADGYDTIFGSGLTTLGSPTFDLATVRNPAVIELSGTLYVGLGNPGSEQLGTTTAPFISIAQAIAAAAPGDRVIVFPGEYVSSMVIDGRTDVSVLAFNSPNAFNTLDPLDNSVIWVNDSWRRQAGIYVQNSSGIVIDGFVFRQASPQGIVQPGPNSYSLRTEPNAIGLMNTSNSQILNGNFSGFGEPPITVGDVDFGAIPPAPVANSGGSGNVIRGNIFENNLAIQESSLPSVLEIVAASANPGDTPIRIQGNIFRNNGGVPPLATLKREAIIDVIGSGAEFFGNRFYNNIRQAVFFVDNPGTGYELRLVSNLFQQNQISGPLVHLDPGRRLRFINNTVAGNSFMTDVNYGWVVLRGNEVGTIGSGSWTNGGGQWEIHNNIIFDNFLTGGAPGFAADQTDTFTCDSIDVPGVDDAGARSNWLWATTTPMTNFGECEAAINDPSNRNILDRNPNTDVNGGPAFVGPTVSPTDPFRVVQGSTAIDRGDNSALTQAMIDAGDALGFPRVQDGASPNPPGIPINPAEVVELGAYELTPLSTEPILDLNREEDTFNRPGDSPNGAFRFNLAGAVIGGFPSFNFTIRTMPLNYSTNPVDFCGGSGLVIQGTFAYYCPPQHFYTRQGDPPGPGTPVVDDVSFEYWVTDSTGGDPVPGTVTIRIFDTPDQILNAGDAVSYRFLAQADDTFSFRLRPFVGFNNFRFSERGTARNNKADYPFTINSNSIIVLTEPGDNPNLFSDNPDPTAARAEAQTYIRQQVASAVDGLITLDPENDEIGTLSFSYTATDARGGSVTNTIILEVRGIVPDRGLHDDTSFSFEYTDTNPADGNGRWTAVYSEININNTLHQTRTKDDIARFLMIGEQFHLYMQAQRAGGLWELRIDDKPLTWTFQASTGNWRGVAAGEGFNCFTLQNVVNNRISNVGTAPYTISCTGLRDAEAHEIEIINAENKLLQVDALALKFETDPLLPGRHDVNEPDLLQAFPSWSLITDPLATSGIARAATSSSASDAIFSFRGTGIAIGTTLERFGTRGNYQGASYDICVRPEGSTNEICQNFNNLTNAARPTWNVFRTFSGYDPNGTHRVRIDVKTIPTGGRLVIDTIQVLDQAPNGPLAIGVTENDEIGKIVFGNGRDDSWVFDTRSRTASNGTLHSIAGGVSGIGPFVSFQIPNQANIIHWYRVPNTRTDSDRVLICIDRAQGETGIASSRHCREVNLKLASTPNPIIIAENDTAFGGGWGMAWGPGSTHTVEIFSLNEGRFNVDKIVVLSTDAALQPGYYEDFMLDVNDIDATPTFSYFNAAGVLNGGAFTRVNNTRASGKSFLQTNLLDEGLFFQMNGTGFRALFTLDAAARNVEICWTNGLVNSVAAVGTANCRTFNNQIPGSAVIYQAGRVVAGLSSTPSNFTVAIRSKGGSMKFDALEILGVLAPNSLEPNANGVRRYETSFANRLADGWFSYLGTGWRSVSGTAARLYSGSNYDNIANRVGAGIVFSVDNADVVQIYRQANSRNAALQVCLDGVTCTNFTNVTEPVVINLPDNNLHVLSVVTTSNGPFNLDSVAVYENVPLAVGFYEDNYGLLRTPNGVWTSILGSRYSQGRGRQTSTANADLLFHMTGSLVQIGAFAPTANQTEICSAPGIVTNPSDPSFVCENWPAAGSTARQIYQLDLTSSAVYTIRIRNLNAGPAFVLDYISILDGVAPLLPGFYEQTHPKVQSGFSGTWEPAAGVVFSGGSAAQTTEADAALVFDFTGTGFQIGMTTGRTHGNVRICYEAGALSSFAAITDIDQYCYDYNNQTTAANFNTSRTVAGLPQNTYSVRLVNLTSTNPTGPAVVDYVQIFDGQPPVAPTGIYNENAADSSGAAYLQLVPASRWQTVAGPALVRFSGSSYAAVVDTTGRLTRLFAGPAALLRVNVPAAGSTTIVLDTGLPNARSVERLLVCVDHTDNVANATPDTCQTITTMRTQQQQVFTLTAAQYGAGAHSVTFRGLTAGEFRIDGFQVLENNFLAEGIYDDSLMRDTGTPIDLGGAWQTPPTTGTRNARAYGGTQIRTRASNATLDFAFEGTGFSLITQRAPNGINFQMCYVLAASFDGTWDGSGETCVAGTTDIARGTQFQVGHSVYGLEAGQYRARIGVNDTSIDSTRDWLYVDALVIFGALDDVLTAGLYDDAQFMNYSGALRFGPPVFWNRTVSRSGPIAGPYQLGETGAANAGAMVQMAIEGNAMTLYQTVDTRSSDNVRVCIVVDAGDTNSVQCSEFSQTGRRTFFTPIMFFGLGDGEHTLIFENRSPGRRFSIDAVQVVP